ncbi:MAG TPA: hypothetical protein VNL71_21215 [Chloroflexota bacterium]|nr:hypothetical protein [Chloroflexota bacterium]
MLKYDPFAPMIRAEMADRWERAAQARLRRSVREGRTPTRRGPVGPLWRLLLLVKGTAPATMEGVEG